MNKCKNKTVNVTISKRYFDDKKCMSISIQDENSGIKIIEIEMNMESFLDAITGLAYSKGTIKFLPDKKSFDNIGKKRETKSIFVERPPAYDSEERIKSIKESVEKSNELVDGWHLFDDGCRSKQNGKKHKVVLKRYV